MKHYTTNKRYCPHEIVTLHIKQVTFRICIDYLHKICYNVHGAAKHPEKAIRWRLLPLTGNADSFCLLERGGDVLMFVTWELLFLFAGFLIALLTYIDNHNKKN